MRDSRSKRELTYYSSYTINAIFCRLVPACHLCHLCHLRHLYHLSNLCYLPHLVIYAITYQSSYLTSLFILKPAAGDLDSALRAPSDTADRDFACPNIPQFPFNVPCLLRLSLHSSVDPPINTPPRKSQNSISPSSLRVVINLYSASLNPTHYPFLSPSHCPSILISVLFPSSNNHFSQTPSQLSTPSREPNGLRPSNHLSSILSTPAPTAVPTNNSTLKKNHKILLHIVSRPDRVP
jgi:hypothetical protein